MSTYATRMTKGYKVSPNLNFECNSPASIEKMSDLEILDNVLLVLNDGQNETGYLLPRGNLKTVVLTTVI